MFYERSVMFTERAEDCPAANVCDALGNLRKSCIKGGNILIDDEMRVQRCMAGIILLLASVVGAKLPVPRNEAPPPNPSD